MSSLPLRRAIVFLGAVAALYAGGLAIRAAAGWSGQSQPLAEPPPDAAALVAQLVDERSRAEQLTAQLQEAIARSQELESALAAVTDKAARDARSAQRLASRLDGARAKLLELQRQLAARPAPTVTVAVPAPSMPGPPSGGGEGDDGELEDDH
jgi:hypothetical protein